VVNISAAFNNPYINSSWNVQTCISQCTWYYIPTPNFQFHPVSCSLCTVGSLCLFFTNITQQCHLTYLQNNDKTKNLNLQVQNLFIFGGSIFSLKKVVHGFLTTLAYYRKELTPYVQFRLGRNTYSCFISQHCQFRPCGAMWKQERFANNELKQIWKGTVVA
jgi:hypothetical protein